jgi:predicted NBD/HSP70 family sugar kinase
MTRKTSEGSAAALRQRNSSRVLEVIRSSAIPLRVAEIATATGLSRPTVETVSEGLLEQDWLTIADPAPSAGPSVGRPARLYRFNDRAAYVMGVDIGAHTVSVALGDLSGNFVVTAKTRVQPDMAAEGRLSLAADAIGTLLRNEGVDAGDVLALTVGTPGTVSPLSPVVGISPGLPGWAHVDVRSALAEVIDCEVALENDANLAVVGERTRGVAAGAADVIFLLLGERLGAGVIANGDLIRGRDGAAGEVGYVPVPGAPEHDPRYGPLEAQVNASALVQRGRTAAAAHPESSLNQAQVLTAETITKEASLGDAVAIEVIEHLASDIARGIAPSILTLNPEVLVIGGGISRGGEVLRASIEDAIAEAVLYVPRVVISALGDEAVLVGAVAKALERVEVEVLARVSA